MTVKRVTLSDIAVKSGVSIATVAKVISGGGPNIRVSPAKAEHIRQIAANMNYQPNILAQRLAGRSSRIIGVLIDTKAPPPRFRLLAEIEREATLRGYRCMIGEAHDNVENLRQNYDIFMQYGIDGVISLAHDYPEENFKFEKQFQKIIYNMVFIDEPPISGATRIMIDRAESMRQAVRHLYDRGARRIGQVLRETGSKTSLQRSAGFRTAMKELGFSEPEISKNAMMLKPYHAVPQLAGESREIIEKFIIPRKLDAIMMPNDLSASALFNELHRGNLRIPEDIRVIGYNNEDFSTVSWPSLTTIDENQTLQGRVIIDLLLDKLEQKEKFVDPQIVVTPQLIIRNST